MVLKLATWNVALPVAPHRRAALSCTLPASGLMCGSSRKRMMTSTQVMLSPAPPQAAVMAFTRRSTAG